MEAYGLKVPEHTAPSHAHAHSLPGHHDLEKTYRTIMEHHPHGPIHHEAPHTVEYHPTVETKPHDFEHTIIHHHDVEVDTEHLPPHHHHVMSQKERDLRPHFIHPVDHDKEREIFEEEWGSDYHHPVTFAPAFHPKAKAPAHEHEEFHFEVEVPHKHEDTHIHEIYEHKQHYPTHTTHPVAPHV